MKLYVVALALLMPVLTGCPVFSFSAPPSIPVRYEAKGVCEHIVLTSNRNTVSIIFKGEDRVSLTVGVSERIPAINPAPNFTWYTLSGPPVSVNEDILVDLTWHCRPGKEAISIQFTHKRVSSGPRKGLTITEDASLPSGLRIEVTDFNP